MACMYKLFNRVPDGMKTMLNHISEHLKNQGKDLVTEDDNVQKNPVHFVTVWLRGFSPELLGAVVLPWILTLMDWLIDWLIDCSVDWLIGWS